MNILNLEILEEKKKPFMIYADCESILVPEDNGKQIPNESYTSKYQEHVACSYGHKLACVDDKFSDLFKSYFGKDGVYSFFRSMIKESKHFIDVIKTNFNKELVMTKEDNENFENSTKFWTCDNDYADGDVMLMIMIMLMVMIIIISLENTDVLHVAIETSMLN